MAANDTSVKEASVHGVYSSVDHLDDLVQDNEGRLQACKFDKSLDSPSVRFSTPLHLLATFAQARQSKVVGGFDLETLECWQEDT